MPANCAFMVPDTACDAYRGNPEMHRHSFPYLEL